MKYEKPVVDVLTFENDSSFMTASAGPVADYSTPLGALSASCTGFSGQTNNFSCGVFGGYASYPGNKVHVKIGNDVYTYEFISVGNGNGGHWKQV